MRDQTGRLSQQCPSVQMTQSVVPMGMTPMWLSPAKEAETAGKAFSTFDLYPIAMTTIEKMDQKIIAVNADTEISGILHIPVGTAVLVLETVIYNSRMEAVEHKRGYYRTDKYSFKLHRSI